MSGSASLLRWAVLGQSIYTGARCGGGLAGGPRVAKYGLRRNLHLRHHVDEVVYVVSDQAGSFTATSVGPALRAVAATLLPLLPTPSR